MKSKLRVFLLLNVLLVIPFFIFAQTNSSSTPLNIADIIKSLEAPKIIQNNVRITKLDLTKTEVDSNNQIVIEGTVEIKNYAKTPTSRLYMSPFVGIKGTSYYLQYPLYTGLRTDAFILEPNQSVTKTFKVVEKNFLKYGSAGIEVWITDEYSKQVHIESSRIGDQFSAPSVEKGTIFSDFETTLVVDDKEFVPSNGPTFYPDTEDMFLKFNFKTPTAFIENAHIKIFDRNFFTTPIKEMTQELVPAEAENQFTLSIPKDLEPGVYPFDVKLVNTDDSIFIPHIYGRFIVGGNISKVTDVSLRSENFGVQGLTLVVQGNAPDIVNPDREKDVNFSAEVFAYDKNDTLLFSKKVDNQTVSIYRNIDIDFDKTIGVKKITKVKVELSDETGIFNTYTKEFTYKTSFNWWNVLFALGSMVILGMILILKKKKLITAFVFLLIFSSFFTPHAEAGMSPAPYKQLGVYEYDAWDFDFTSASTICNTPGLCSGLNSVSPRYSPSDRDIKRFDNILDIFGINITFDQPTLYTQDPNFCYAPGQVIPVVMRYDYGICSNSPVTSCGSGNCNASTTVPISSYATIYVYPNPTDWFSNLRNWEILPNFINDVNYNSSYSTSTSTSIDSAISGIGVVSNYQDRFVPFDLDYLASFVDQVAAQSQSESLSGSSAPFTSSNIAQMNINVQRINEITTYMAQPISAQRVAVPITLSGFTAGGSYSYSIVAPEKPGIYTFPFAMNFRGKQGNGHYLAQHQIKVCDSTHDADYLMSGIQTVDSSGDLKDQDGSTLTGYTIQKYPNISPVQIKGSVNSVGSGWIEGFNASPNNEFAFVTTANYCGAKPMTASSWVPEYLNNKWINYFSSVYNLSTKIGWYNLSQFLLNIPSTETRIPVFGYSHNAISGFYTAPRATSDGDLLTGQNNFDINKNIVRRVGNELRFIDLSNPIFPLVTLDSVTNQSIIKTILRLEDLVSIPTLSLNQMLSTGKFNGTHINSSTNTDSNTFLIKDSRTFSGISRTTSCSLYEDFCPSVAGVQYLVTDSTFSNLEVWNIKSDNTHARVGFTSRFSPKATVDALCALVPPSTFAATCSVESPAVTADRNPNTSIQFKVVATGTDPNFPITYTWQSATALTDQSRATKTYTTTGDMNDVKVTVTNGSLNTITASCPVDIVGADFIASCTGNSVVLGQDSTYTAAFVEGATYKWLENNGAEISGEIGRTYTTRYGSVDSYPVKVAVTKDMVTKESNTCYATVTSGTGPVLPVTVNYSFDPYIAKAPPVNTCTLNLDVQNITSCKLVGPTTINLDDIIDVVNNSINTTDKEVPIGTYTLKCSDMSEPPVENSYGTRKCISNPTIKEN